MAEDMFKILIDVTERTVATLHEVISSQSSLKDLSKENKELLIRAIDSLTKIEQILTEDRIYRSNKSKVIDVNMEKAIKDLDQVTSTMKSLGDYQFPSIFKLVSDLNGKFDKAIESNKSTTKIVSVVIALFALLQIAFKINW